QRRQPADRAMAEHEKATQYRAKLEAIYRPAGITDADPEGSARRWDDAVAHVDTYVTSIARPKELRDSHIAVAGDQDMAGLVKLVRELERQSQQAPHGPTAASPEPYRAVRLADLE